MSRGFTCGIVASTAAVASSLMLPFAKTSKKDETND